MTPEATVDFSAQQEQKRIIREQAHANRRAQENKEQLSKIICDSFAALPEYQSARTVLFYMDVRTEVRTRDYLATALAHGKQIAVPWCRPDGHLELFALASMDELEIGMYKILEPRANLRELAEKRV